VQWTADGVALCTAAGDQFGPTFVSDGLGGAIATWTDERNGSANGDIYAQRVNGSGVVQWTTDGVALCAALNNQGGPTIASDAAGGWIVAWIDYRSTDWDIYAQRVSGSGVVQWAVNGVAVCNVVDSQYNASIVSYGGGGVIVAWDDYRGGTPDIYAQRLNTLGLAQWTVNGALVCSAPGYQIGPELVSDGSDGAIAAWGDHRNDPMPTLKGDVYAQRVNASGVVQWIPGGTSVCTAPDRQDEFGITPDGAGGAYVTWWDKRIDAGDIYAQRLNSNGAALLSPDGVALCIAVGDQDRPGITYIGNGSGAVVTWEDNRNGDYDIYALPVSNTRIGFNVRYIPIPYLFPGPLNPVHLVFDHVITAGFTYLDITPAGPQLPPSFVLGDGWYYNLGTTAGTTDNIQVCIKFDPAALQHPAAALRMFEYNVAGPAGPTWLDVTTGSAAGDSICGTTTTLSTFVIGFPSVTGVGDAPAPANFVLHPNLPNPFNPITTIRYDVPVAGADVNISIYDVSGRLVRELVKEHRGAGTWSVQWNGENDRGQSVASGVYFYRMRAGEFVETRKMMLLK